MGKVIKINPAEIQPSQDFLKVDTLAFIWENYTKGNFDSLPSNPIVRENPQGGYIAIDGHNLLAFYASKNLDCEVYVAEHKDDALVGDSEMIEKRNKDLFEKYDWVLVEVNRLAEKRIVLIADLVKHYNHTGIFHE